MSSGSRSLQRKRRVLPRIYSLGCCKSFRMPLLPSCQRTHPGPITLRNLPNEDHLLFQFPIGVDLRANLVIEIEEFFEWFAF
jgi:hypothetical protein